MANAVCFACMNSVIIPKASSNSSYIFVTKSQKVPNSRFNFSLISDSRSIQPLRAEKEGTSKTAKVSSIVCGDCDGNGAIVCTQCEGKGVNSKDHFNGQFKAGASCWLCRGKREILCGNCNGAGFLGGFMSTFEET